MPSPSPALGPAAGLLNDGVRIETVGGYVIALAFIIILLGGMALITMRVFEQASRGPAAMTVVVMLSFLTMASILAAVVVEGTGKEFITLAAAGIGALAGAVTGLYGPRGGTPQGGDDDGEAGSQ